MNSPADDDFAARDSADGSLTFAATQVAASLTAANSIVNGINPIPNNMTGGEGPVTGEEVRFDVNFATPLDVAAGHYFFRPEVGLSDGTFLLLSAAGPIVTPGVPPSDLQTWMRGSDITPDWERPGADIVGGQPFNASFSLTGATNVPEPASLGLLGAGLLGLVAARKRRA